MQVKRPFRLGRRAKRTTAAVALILALAFAVCASQVESPPERSVETGADLEVYALEGCPRCTEAEPFLERLRRARPDLRIQVFEISSDEDARRRLTALAAGRDVTALSTPTFYVGGELIVGWVDEESTGARILSLLPPEPSGRATAAGPAAASRPPLAPDEVEVPWLGRLGARRFGLAFFSLVIGLLDGFNPCAMWALLFLLSMLVNLRDRRKMLLIGGTFIAVGGALYYAFMAAWLEVFLFVGLSRAVQVALGAVAVLVGVVNVKDFFAFRRGVSLSIPEAAKPKIYERTRRILTAQNVAGALLAVATVSALVNLVELLCTAGLPAAYTHILTTYRLPRWQYYGYLLLYVMAYVLDDAVMLAAAVVTLGRLKLQERGGRWLKLVSGLVMLALGAALLVRPAWLL